MLRPLGDKKLGIVRPPFLLLVCSLLLPSFGWCADGKWPEMKEVSVRYSIDARADKIEIDLPLHNKAGFPQYLFWCRGGSERYLDGLSENLRIDFVAPFSCRLNRGTKRSDDSLLAEDDSPIWHTRGQFRYEELVGDCGAYPEFGRIRTFRLRGFKLTLAASDVETDASGAVKSFELDVSLKSDTSAKGKMGQRPSYRSAYGEGRSCKTILKGRDRRYCRNWAKGGSYELCKD